MAAASSILEIKMPEEQKVIDILLDSKKEFLNTSGILNDVDEEIVSITELAREAVEKIDCGKNSKGFGLYEKDLRNTQWMSISGIFLRIRV